MKYYLQIAPLKTLNAKILEIIEYKLTDATDRRTIILVKKTEETC